MKRKKKFDFRKGSRQSGDAQAAGEALEKIKADNDGLLTASLVVDEARPEDSDLHPFFLWEDSEAAEEFRKIQARTLIRAVVVLSDPGSNSPSAPFLVHVPKVRGDDGTDGHEGHYEYPEVVIRDVDQFERALEAAVADQESANRRVDELAVLARSNEKYRKKLEPIVAILTSMKAVRESLLAMAG